MHKLLLITLMILLSIGLVSAQDSISPQLQTQLNEIEAITSRIRNLDRLESTLIDFPSQADLQAYLEEQFENEFETEEFADNVLFYVGLDLLEPDIDIKTALYDFLLSQIAGFYDSDDQSMNVILMSGDIPEDSLPIAESVFYSHEYVHALQDQHFDLDVFDAIMEDTENVDFQLAIIALIEGDASQVMLDYALELAKTDAAGVTNALSNVDSEIPDTVPQVIVDEFYFPYFDGQAFVYYLVNNAGWEAVDEAFTERLPQSTEQIYHPERYLSGDMPIAVDVPDMMDLLGDDWRLAKDTSVGEFYLRKHLGTQFKASVAEDMSTGWGGDRMKLYVNDATGDLTWVLYQVWDTAQDATEFADLYREFLDLRFGAKSDDGICWSGADTMCFVQIADDETRISFATQTDLALPMLGQTN